MLGQRRLLSSSPQAPGGCALGALTHFFKCCATCLWRRASNKTPQPGFDHNKRLPIFTPTGQQAHSSTFSYSPNQSSAYITTRPTVYNTSQNVRRSSRPPHRPHNHPPASHRRLHGRRLRRRPLDQHLPHMSRLHPRSHPRLLP